MSMINNITLRSCTSEYEALYFYLKYILICFSLLGCAQITTFEQKLRFEYKMNCVRVILAYEKKCRCDFYPRGLHPEEYCREWARASALGYNVTLDVPEVFVR